MKILISLPSSTYKILTQNIPTGKRSAYIAKLITEDLAKKHNEKTASFWRKIERMNEGCPSYNEDPVKLAKEAWNEIISKYE